MTGFETRSVSRDSLFLLAGIQIENAGEHHRVRVRNLSNGGMMGEGNLRVKRGNRLDIELKNVGAVAGTVAWVQDDRFGIAFDEEIDSQLARKAAPIEPGSPADMVGRNRAHQAPAAPDPNGLRKL
ncbi:MAG: PilZ domain-containing protein [Erythrobacter sp.]